MADVTGAISTLPGAHYAPPEGTMCDNHPRRLATHRIQGETDSMGSEMHDLCDSCTKKMRRSMNSAEARSGRCDWCKCKATDLRARRDYEEGMRGPVYRVCGVCAKRQAERIAEEAREYEDDRYDWEPDSPYDDEPDLQCHDDPYTSPGEQPHELVVQAYAPYGRQAKATCRACRQPWKPGHKCASRTTVNTFSEHGK